MKFLFLVLVIFLICLFIQEVKLENSDWPLIKKCSFLEGFGMEKEGEAEMCLFWSTLDKTFHDAQNDCEGRHARLGVFKDPVMFRILVQSRRRPMYSHVWVGLDDRRTEGTFTWHDGTVFQKHNYTQYFAQREICPSGLYTVTGDKTLLLVVEVRWESNNGLISQDCNFKLAESNV